MIIVLPLILLLFFWVRLAGLEGGSHNGLRDSFLRAALLYGAAVVALIEGLGALLLLNTQAVTTCFVVLVCVVALWPGGPGAVRRWADLIRRRWEDSRRRDIVFGLVLCLWFAVLLVIAVMAAPGNNDSLSYRLPRVMEWWQNKTVAFFPTQFLPQNYHAPFAEWNLLVLALLSGGDRWFALVQWSAMVGSCIVVSLLAGQLGADRMRAQQAIALVACAPMAVLQATSTQNDLTAGFFLAVFVYFGLRATEKSPVALSDAAWAGLALGLGALTKLTAGIFAMPFVVWIGLRMVSRGWVRGLAASVLASAIGLAVWAGHGWRNTDMFGRPTGPAGVPASRGAPVEMQNTIMWPYGPATMDPFRLSDVLFRNAALHGNIPEFPAFGAKVTDAVWRIAEILGLPYNDPATTWRGGNFWLYDVRHEDLSGNFPQLFLFSLASLSLLSVSRREAWLRAFFYWLCLGVAALLFCLLLRWQLFNSRYHLALFTVMAPFTAALLPLPRPKVAGPLVMVGLAAWAWPFLVANDTRPLLGSRSIFTVPRDRQYFTGDEDYYNSVSQVVGLLAARGVDSFGLQVEGAERVYPFWALYQSATGKRPTITQVNVTNCSRDTLQRPTPSYVVVTYPLEDSVLRVDGWTYGRIHSDRYLSLFQKDPAPTP